MSVDNLATAYGLDSPFLGKGPINVPLGILRGVEAVAFSLIEWDVLFQPVRQIGLPSSPSEIAESALWKTKRTLAKKYLP